MTATGSVTNAKVVEEAAVDTSSGHLGEALVMARSCTFTPARPLGNAGGGSDDDVVRLEGRTNGSSA